MKPKEKASIKVLRAVYEELDEKGVEKTRLAPAIDRAAVRLGWFPGSVRTWIRTLVSSGHLYLDQADDISITAEGTQLLEKERVEG